MPLHHVPWEPVLFGIVKFLKAFGLIPGAAAAVGMQRFYQRWRQKKAMEGWPATDATIQSGQVQHDSVRSYWVEITYSYYVGEYRVGRYLKHFRKEDAADDFVRQLKDKRLRVHYDPNHPDKSVFLERDLEMVVLMMPQLR